jgi:amidohydrolase
MTIDVEAAKRDACALVDQWADRLVAASHDIHAHPELNFEERYAHDLLCDVLDDAGLAPTRHAYGLETGFSADAGSDAEGAVNVGVMCEYDALPGIGHACGHNIIATAGLGAGLALAAIADDLGGRVRILGTPAEEGGGGKIFMAREGALEGLSAAMMVHPADADLLHMDAIAIHTLRVEYTGRAAHAAAAPWEGINALDAAVQAYTSIAAMRQHIRPNERVHGVFTKGGDKANIVPALAEMSWMVRSPTVGSLQPLKQRVVACLESAAVATGCSCTVHWREIGFAEMRDNQPMALAYADNAARLGRTVRDPAASGHHVVGSTDMGNISHLVPSIHPMIKVAPTGTAIHTLDFAEWARSDHGDQAVIDGAKIMAMTAIDLWTSPQVLAAARADFDRHPPADGVI